MARPRAGSPGLTDDLRARARAWAEQSCADQQLPVKITDTRALASVVCLLGVRAVAAGTPGTVGASPAGSELPDGLKAGRVEAVEPRAPRSDDDVVKDGADDRVLPGQRQARPALPQPGAVTDVTGEHGRAA